MVGGSCEKFNMIDDYLYQLSLLFLLYNHDETLQLKFSSVWKYGTHRIRMC